MSMNDRNSLMIRSLETQVANLTEENSSQKSKYDKRFETLVEENNKKVEQLQIDHKLERENLVSDYESRLNASEQQFNEKILNLEVSLSKNFNAENQRLVAERNELRERLESSASQASAAIDGLEKDLNRTQEALKSAEKMLAELNATCEALNGERNMLEQVRTFIDTYLGLYLVPLW